MSYDAVEKGKREESTRCRGGSGTARAGNNGLFRIGMTVQSLFFTRCPWRDTKSAHARAPPAGWALHTKCPSVSPLWLPNNRDLQQIASFGYCINCGGMGEW